MTRLEQHLDEWIAAAVTGGLDEGEMREFQDYLATHAEARRAYEEALAMSRLLEETLKHDEPDPAFEDRMVAGVRRRLRDRRHGMLLGFLDLLSGPRLAAVSVAAVLIVSFSLGKLMEPDPRQGGVASMAGLSSEPGFLKKLALSLQVMADPTLVDNGRSSGLEMAESDFGGFINYGSPIHGVVAQKGLETATELDFDAAPMPMDRELPKESPSLFADSGMLTINGPTGTEILNLQGANTYTGTLTTPMKGREPAPSIIVQDGNVSLASNLSRSADQPGKGKEWRRGAEIPERTKSNMPAGGPKDEISLGEKKETAASGTDTAEAPDRKLIRNGQLALEVKSYGEAVRQIGDLARAHGGFIATQNDRTQANGRSAGQIVAKVVPERLEAFMDGLRGLGTVKHQVLKTDDVTKAYFDTAARLRNARVTEQRLIELMGTKTTKVSELLEVEKEIARVRESIEQMQGELKLWDALSHLATVTVDLSETDLDKAAAYLLKESANISVYAPDVEQSYQQARALAEKSGAQILNAEISRDASGRMGADLRLLVAPENAFGLIGELKRLGRLNSFEQDSTRVAQDGSAGVDGGSVRKDRVEVHLAIAHDDASRKTIQLQLITPDVEKTLDACKGRALELGSDVLASQLQRTPQGSTTAQLTVRVPGRRAGEMQAFFASQGRTAHLSVQRNDPTGTNTETDDGSPVILSLALSDEEPPVQATRVVVETARVTDRVEALKKTALQQGVEIRSSSFNRDPNGQEKAQLVFRLPQKNHAAFLEALQKDAKTLDLALQRQDRTGMDPERSGEDPVQITATLQSPSPLMQAEGGWWAGLRRSAARSCLVLLKSASWIAQGFAFLLPWLLLAAAGFWGWRKFRRSR